MKNFSRFLSFRVQIIGVVVALSMIPVALFGFYALQSAGKSQIESNKIKNTLLLSLSKELEDYFRDINASLAYTRVFEKRLIRSGSEVGKILFNALEGEEEILSIGYLKDKRVAHYYGEEIKEPTLDERITILLRKYEEKKWIQVTDSYRIPGGIVFDLLYPLDTGDFVFQTVSLDNIEEKLLSNIIGKTGFFSLLNGDGTLFVGEDVSKTRAQFLGLAEMIEESKEDFIIENKRGYQIKARKLQGMSLPFWIVFTQKATEANALTNQLKYSIFVILIALLVIAGLVSFTFANSFSRPISNLLKAVKKNSEGDLEMKAFLDKKDSGELALLIQEFNRMIDSLKEARDKLVEKEKLAAVGEMASVIGHDIRNPLAAIKNGIYYLRYSVKTDNPRIGQTMDIVDREIESIKKIIEDLLGYSRQRPPALSEVEVNALLDEVISIIELPENIKIEKEYDESIDNYNLDRGEMRQVLVNLINNAAQACNKDSGVVKVISKQDQDGKMRIVIKDNGMGIPKEKIDKIFEAFYSTKEGGTGLGLASAKRITERHQGNINIESKVNVGTDISIIIPKLENTKGE